MSFLHLDLHHASWTSVLPSFLSSASYVEYSRALSTALLRALRLSDWQRLFYGYLVPLLHDTLRILDVFDRLKVSSATFLSIPSAGIASILCSASLVFITWILSFCFSTSRCSTNLCETSSLLPLDDIDVEILHALQTVIIPTTSHWPPHYIALANRSRARSTFGSARGQTKTKTICVPLSVLIRDVVAGDVGFRNARRDLPKLLMLTRTREGGVVVAEERAGKVRVKLEVDTTFWSEVAWRVLWRGVVGDLGWSFDRHGKVDEFLSLARQAPGRNGRQPLDLDYVPHSRLDHVLSRIKTSESESATPTSTGLQHFKIERERETMTLELTMRNACLMELATLSSASSLLAFPFLPSTYPASASCGKNNDLDNKDDRHRYLSKSTTPLNITLPELIRRLEQQRFDIVSVMDVSKERAEELWEDVKRLEMYEGTGEWEDVEDGRRRRREVGLKRAWEAGLLEGGMLARWRVVVTGAGSGRGT